MPLLNANCGDMLKAAILEHLFEFPKINPIWLSKPSGDAEKAFSVAKQVVPAENPAERALAEFKRDIVDTPDKRHLDPQIQNLVKASTTAKIIGEMPASLRFEDKDDEPLSAPPPATSVQKAELISLAEAAVRFSYSPIGLSQRLKRQGVAGQTQPGSGRTLFFSLEEVERACANKGSHAK